MHETGPQVLSPVRKPNQVDTVTWDVTRDFSTRWRAFKYTFRLPTESSPISFGRILLETGIGTGPSLPIVRSETGSGSTFHGVSEERAKKPIFLPICTPFYLLLSESSIEQREISRHPRRKISNSFSLIPYPPREFWTIGFFIRRTSRLTKRPERKICKAKWQRENPVIRFDEIHTTVSLCIPSYPFGQPTMISHLEKTKCIARATLPLRSRLYKMIYIYTYIYIINF